MIGEVLNDRWRWQREKYVALKINSSSHHSRENAAQAELDILKRIPEADPRHKGFEFVRRPLDSFNLENGLVRHLSLVFEPLREPLWIYRQMFIGDVIPSGVLKILLQMILHGLDYLHPWTLSVRSSTLVCPEVLDLKPDNIMIRVEDPSILEHSARDEYDHHLPQKMCPDGRIIYLSLNDLGISEKTTGIVQITDFDLSVRGGKPNKGCIQAEIYRAPEVVLDAGYSYSADIWSLGVMGWLELLRYTITMQKPTLLYIHPLKAHEYDELGHLGHISSLLGPPPKELLDKGTRTDLFYDSDGRFKGTNIAPSKFNFEHSIRNLRNEDKRIFIKFVRRMIIWDPEERSTATELLHAPWLYAEWNSMKIELTVRSIRSPKLRMKNAC
ncbi:unnamed protein product [Penicillium salamii]|nr:unnamed protein product [Penicillium salamii]